MIPSQGLFRSLSPDYAPDYANYIITPGAQIAHDLYRHFEYTGDEAFLTTYTLPILDGWVCFMADYLKKGEDGRYHVPKADPYETTWAHCEDITCALAYIRLRVEPGFDEETLGRSGEFSAQLTPQGTSFSIA